MFKLLIYLTILIPFFTQAKILELSQVINVINFIDQDTWLLVDLDNTLFEAKQALGHANWFYDEIDKRMQQGMSKEEAIKDAYPLWIKVQEICPVKPMESSFIILLKELQKRGHVIMGLTHRQPSVASATIRQVNSLEIDFKETAPSKENFSIPAATPALYTDGILFVGDYNKKGTVFLPFLSIIQKLPKKIVFIDDKRKNVEELEQALAENFPNEIQYVGIHYTAYEHVKPVYDRKIAEFQAKFLDKIISNEEALLLMRKGF
jgi:hypothetical protein